MKGICLTFYMSEKKMHHGIPLYDWLLRKGKEMGLKGGSAFRAIAGFGRHGSMHSEHFFEMASDLPIEVVFVLKEEEVEKFLDALANENLNIFYIKAPIDYGMLNLKGKGDRD